MQEQSCVFSANFGCNIMSEVPPCYRLEGGWGWIDGSAPSQTRVAKAREFQLVETSFCDCSTPMSNLELVQIKGKKSLYFEWLTSFLTYHLEVVMASIFWHSIWQSSDIYFDILSDILSGILAFYLDLFWHSFGHSIWHFFRRSF